MSDGKPAAEGGGKIRQVILVVVLLAVVAGGVYEYAFARPAYSDAQNKVVKLSEQSDASNLTDVDIHKELGVEPSAEEIIENRQTKIETYAYARGLPFMNFKMYVWYKKSKQRVSEPGEEPKYEEKWFFTSFKAGERPGDSDLPPVKEGPKLYEGDPPVLGDLAIGGGRSGNDFERPTGNGDEEGNGEKEKETEEEGNGSEVRSADDGKSEDEGKSEDDNGKSEEGDESEDKEAEDVEKKEDSNDEASDEDSNSESKEEGESSEGESSEGESNEEGSEEDG